MKILVVGDIHFPYHNKRALKKIFEAIKREKPTHVVQIGDLYDQYAFSRFNKKNIELPQNELKKAVILGSEFWRTVRNLCRNVTCYQILGNHDVRLVKRAEERLPEAQELVREKVNELYTFKGVKTFYDDRTEVKICGITFMHGFRSKLGDHAKFNGLSTVCGHSHTGGVVYEQRNGRIIWELNAGYLADEKSEPLRYSPQTTRKWTLGYGLITFRGKTACPQFIPLD
jgi:predicted phosphodiesterase